MSIAFQRQERIMAVPISTDKPESVAPPKFESRAAQHIRAHGVPGNRADNAIPPSDTKWYRELQIALGLKKDQWISSYTVRD